MIHRSRIFNRILHIAYHLLYYQFSWSYDFVADLVSAGQWKNWVFETLPYLTGPRVLEIGFGPGHLLQKLHSAGLFSVGLDLSWNMLRGSRRRSRSMLLVNGYAQYMPFVNQAFDQVVSTFPADFIFEPHCLYEIYRILKPGAKLIILPTAWVNSNRNNLLYKSVHSYNPPLNYFDALCEKLQACGFEVQRQQRNLGASTLLLIIATKGFSPY